MNIDYVTCPVCGKQLKGLRNHLIFKHNMTDSEIKEKFKGIPMQVVSKPKDIKCEYCDRHFTTKGPYTIHIKCSHPDKYVPRENKSKENSKFVCGLCGFKGNMIYTHVCTAHSGVITWDEYCKKYNHDPNVRAFFSEKHKETLSQNKKKFYSSDVGLIERQKLREKFTGEANPACRPETRSKISKAALRRFKNDESNMNNFMQYSYGTQFRFEYLGKQYRCRSFEEFKAMYVLLINNIPFEYEAKTINYPLLDGTIKNYLLDFYVINKYYIEIKGRSKTINGKGVYFDSEFYEYKKVNEMLHRIGKELIICDFRDLCKLLNVKEPFLIEIYRFAKKLLDDDKCQILYFSQRKAAKNYHYKILENIDPFYFNNKNIVVKEQHYDVQESSSRMYGTSK